MEIKTIAIDSIKPYERNARHNAKAVDAVVKSIRANGYIAPIIVDENGVILAGHTRHKALKKMGVKEVECVVKEGLTEQQKKAYRIADNKTNELAEWDFELLETEINELLADGFDVDSLGFSDSEIENIISSTMQDVPEYKREVYTPPAQQPEENGFDYTNREKQFERPAAFPSFDDEIHTEHRCPKCGYEW